jgi:hypothetical protein
MNLPQQKYEHRLAADRGQRAYQALMKDRLRKRPSLAACPDGARHAAFVMKQETYLEGPISIGRGADLESVRAGREGRSLPESILHQRLIQALMKDRLRKRPSLAACPDGFKVCPSADGDGSFEVRLLFHHAH